MRLGSELNEEDSFLNQRLFVLYGGQKPEDGYYVDVVYETDKQLCTKKEDEGNEQLELIDRWQIGSTVFKNIEEAKADRDHLRAEIEKEKEDYQRKIAEAKAKA